MDHFGPGGDGPSMRLVEILDPEGHLGTGGGAPILRLIEGEVDEGSVGPRRGRVPAAGPTVVPMVIADMEIKPERAVVEVHGAIEIGDLEDRRHQAAPL